MENQIDKLGSEEMNKKELVLRDDLKRLLIYWQIFKYALECIRSSDTLKMWGELAKKAKNKSFVDLRVVAADYQRGLDGMIMKIKKTMTARTWNDIMSTLTSEQVKEIDLLLNEITDLKEEAISRIVNQVKDAKYLAGIPLNSPTDQKKFESVDDLIWSCIQPADNSLTPADSDGYNEGEVYAALKRLYKELTNGNTTAHSGLPGPEQSQDSKQETTNKDESSLSADNASQ